MPCPCLQTAPNCSKLQVFLGSLALVLGLAAGSNTDQSVEVWVVTGTYEALRVLLVAGMVALHRRENIAKP